MREQIRRLTTQLAFLQARAEPESAFDRMFERSNVELGRWLDAVSEARGAYEKTQEEFNDPAWDALNELGFALWQAVQAASALEAFEFVPLEDEDRHG